MEEFSESYISLATNCHVLEQKVIHLENEISRRTAKINLESERYQMLDYFIDNKLKDPHQISEFIIDYVSKYHEVLEDFSSVCLIKFKNNWIVINSNDPTISLLSHSDQFESSFARVPIGFNMNILNWVNPEIFQLSDKPMMVCANYANLAIKINSNILWTFWGKYFHESFPQYIEEASDIFQTASKILWKMMENKNQEIRLLEDNRLAHIYHTLRDSLSPPLSSNLAPQIWSEVPKIFDMLVHHSSCDIYLINPDNNVIYSAKMKQIQTLNPSLLLHTIEKRCPILCQDTSKENVNISIDYSDETDITFHSILLVPLWLSEPENNKALQSYPYSAVIIIKRINTSFDDEELHLISEFLLKSTNILLRWISSNDEAIIENKVTSSSAVTRHSVHPSHCLSLTMNEVLQNGLPGLFRVDFLSIMAFTLRCSWISLLQKTATGYRLFTEDGALHFLPVDPQNPKNTTKFKFNNLFDFFDATFLSHRNHIGNTNNSDIPDDKESRQSIHIVNNYQLSSESIDVEIMQLITNGRSPFSPSIHMLGWNIDAPEMISNEKIMIFAGRTWLPLVPSASECILQSLNSHINHLLESAMKDDVLLLAEDLHIKISHLKSAANQSKLDLKRLHSYLTRVDSLRGEAIPPTTFRQHLVQTLNAFAKEMVNGDVSLVASDTSTGTSWALTVNGVWSPVTDNDSTTAKQTDFRKPMTIKSLRQNRSTSDLFPATPSTKEVSLSTILFQSPPAKFPLATPEETSKSASMSEIRMSGVPTEAETLTFFMFQNAFRDTSLNTSLVFTGMNSDSNNDSSQFITKLIPVVRSLLLERKSDLFDESKEEKVEEVQSEVADHKFFAPAGVADVAGAVRLANTLAIQSRYSNNNSNNYSSMTTYLTATSMLNIMKQYCGVELVTANQPLVLLIYRSYGGSIVRVADDHDQPTCSVNKKTRDILSSFSLCRADGLLRRIQEYAADLIQDHNSSQINNTQQIDSNDYPFSYGITKSLPISTVEPRNHNDPQEEYFHFILLLSKSRPLSVDFLKYFEQSVSLSLLPLVLTQPVYDEKDTLVNAILMSYRTLTSFITTCTTATATATATSLEDDHLKLQQDDQVYENDTDRILKCVVQHCVNVTAAQALCSYVLSDYAQEERIPDTIKSKSKTYKLFHYSCIDGNQISFPNELSENDELLPSLQTNRSSTETTATNFIEISKLKNLTLWPYRHSYRLSFFTTNPSAGRPPSQPKSAQGNRQLLAVVFLGDPDKLKIGPLYASLHQLWDMSVAAMNSMKAITTCQQRQADQSTQLFTDIAAQYHHTFNTIFKQVKQLHDLASPPHSNHQYSKTTHSLPSNDNQKGKARPVTSAFSSSGFDNINDTQESVDDHRHLLIEIRRMLEATAKVSKDTLLSYDLRRHLA